MLHQVRYTLLLSALLLGTAGQAQKLSDFANPVPAAVCAEAPLPAEVAQKYERVKLERQKKFTTPKKATRETIDPEVTNMFYRHLNKNAKSSTYLIACAPSDTYQFEEPNLRLLNSSHGREKIKGEGEKFKVKKDRISYAVLRNDNEIRIVNHKHKFVDMADFLLTSESEAIRIEDGNKIVLNVPVMAIARGEYPLLNKVKCTHIASGLEYNFDVQMSWNKKLHLSGEQHAFALSPIESTASDHLGLLCDLDDKQMMVVTLPLIIEADGLDGKDGKKGKYGANGVDQKSYKDSDGNTHTVAGTCAKPGEDGEDGENGTDGGKFLLCISPELIEAYGMDGLIVTVDAGKGGKGGKGGEGGIHGKGSGCNGKAPDGKDGKNGKDGKKGDFLYVLTDVNTLYQQIIQ